MLVLRALRFLCLTKLETVLLLRKKLLFFRFKPFGEPLSDIVLTEKVFRSVDLAALIRCIGLPPPGELTTLSILFLSPPLTGDILDPFRSADNSREATSGEVPARISLAFVTICTTLLDLSSLRLCLDEFDSSCCALCLPASTPIAFAAVCNFASPASPSTMARLVFLCVSCAHVWVKARGIVSVSTPCRSDLGASKESRQESRYVKAKSARVRSYTPRLKILTLPKPFSDSSLARLSRAPPAPW